MKGLMKEIKVAICIPSTANAWIPQFGLALASLVSNFHRGAVGPAKQQHLAIFQISSSMLQQNRESLFERALACGATHALWLDTDMIFPPDTLRRLLYHRKPIVVAQGVTKKVPAEPTAKGLDGRLVYSTTEKKGLEEVAAVGLAVALMDMKAVKDIPPPRFLMPWDAGCRAYGGEDGFFCKKFRETTGLSLYVDHTLSRQIKHVGLFEYTHSLVGEVVRKEVA